MRTKNIHLRLDPELFLALKQNKIATGVPVQEQIRRFIRLALFADASKVERRSEPILLSRSR